jgi:S1-C subfamily serine protease
VTGVEPGSPAGRALVREGDLIVSVNGQPVRDAGELRSALSKEKDALLRIRRGDGHVFFTVPAA